MLRVCRARLGMSSERAACINCGISKRIRDLTRWKKKVDSVPSSTVVHCCWFFRSCLLCLHLCVTLFPLLLLVFFFFTVVAVVIANVPPQANILKEKPDSKTISTLGRFIREPLSLSRVNGINSHSIHNTVSFIESEKCGTHPHDVLTDQGCCAVLQLRWQTGRLCSTPQLDTPT